MKLLIPIERLLAENERMAKELFSLGPAFRRHLRKTEPEMVRLSEAARYQRRKERLKARYQRNKESIKARVKKHYLENRVKLRAKARARYHELRIRTAQTA